VGGEGRVAEGCMLVRLSANSSTFGKPHLEPSQGDVKQIIHALSNNGFSKVQKVVAGLGPRKYRETIIPANR
jgi:hypothetical protein